MIDQRGEDDRPDATGFGLWAVGGLVVLAGMAVASLEYQNWREVQYNAAFSNGERFLTDNAHGASANAVEKIAHRLEECDQGSAVMRFSVLCLLWLIFLALLRINATIETQTKCLLSSASAKSHPRRRDRVEMMRNRVFTTVVGDGWPRRLGQHNCGVTGDEDQSSL